MSYTVVKEFLDLKNDKYHYKIGDEFQSKGVTKQRIAELAGDSNKVGVPLIVEVAAETIIDEEKEPAKEVKKKDKK